MTEAIHLDFETFSKADLKNFGAYRYASDPSTEILLCAVSKDEPDAPVHLWVNPLYEIPGVIESDPMALTLICHAAEWGSPIYAHNAQFEAAISKYLFRKTFGVPPPKLEQWRCTAAMARRAAIPSSLEKMAEFLGLDVKKDTRGKTLIRKFSIPQTSAKLRGQRILPQDAPEDFRDFGEYCKTDVSVEKQGHRKLAAFELHGDVLEAFQFDMRMNDRGVPVNVEGLKHAETLVNDYTARLTARFESMTGLAPTQGQKCLEWFRSHGYPGKDLTASTVGKVLETGPEAYGMEQAAFDALKTRSLIGFAALKKIPTILGAACPDGHVRGMLLWSGAERTHRWAGRIIQPQNLRRPTVPQTELAYRLICEGRADPEVLEALFGGCLETVASCIRHFIHPKEGFWDADYAAIEARINPWLCGQEDILDAFRRGDPIYEMMASRIFQCDITSIGKNSIERFIGKQAVLGCGFGMGPEKYKQTCENYGQEISQKLAEKSVAVWRATNNVVVNSWKTIGEAAKEAIRNPGKITVGTPLTGRIKFGMTDKAGFPALVMILPSKHKLIYPRARIQKVTKKFKGESYQSDEVVFWGKLPGKQTWGYTSTWGGTLLENATQATAGDVMTHGALEAERRGYAASMLVHDQALAIFREGQTSEEFCEALCTLPDWAEGLPLEAEGGFAPFYRK